MKIGSFGLIGTGNLADGAVTNAKVNTSAAIVSTKLDLSAVAQNITFSGSRNVGSSGTPAANIYMTAGELNGVSLAALIYGMSLIASNRPA